MAGASGTDRGLVFDVSGGCGPETSLRIVLIYGNSRYKFIKARYDFRDKRTSISFRTLTTYLRRSMTSGSSKPNRRPPVSSTILDPL